MISPQPDNAAMKSLFAQRDDVTSLPYQKPERVVPMVTGEKEQRNIYDQ
jgi:hypothetical protein